LIVCESVVERIKSGAKAICCDVKVETAQKHQKKLKKEE
jgi:hypothetical protein